MATSALYYTEYYRNDTNIIFICSVNKYHSIKETRSSANLNLRQCVRKFLRKRLWKMYALRSLITNSANPLQILLL